MNWQSILGSVLVILGAIFNLWGSYRSNKEKAELEAKQMADRKAYREGDIKDRSIIISNQDKQDIKLDQQGAGINELLRPEVFLEEMMVAGPKDSKHPLPIKNGLPQISLDNRLVLKVVNRSNINADKVVISVKNSIIPGSPSSVSISQFVKNKEEYIPFAMFPFYMVPDAKRGYETAIQRYQTKEESLHYYIQIKSTKGNQTDKKLYSFLLNKKLNIMFNELPSTFDFEELGIKRECN